MCVRGAAALRRAADAGTIVVLLTGRPLRRVTALVDALDVRAVVACANGAVVYDLAADRLLALQPLDEGALRNIVATLDAALPGCALAVERCAAIDRAGLGGRLLAEHGHELNWPSHERAAGISRRELLQHPAVKLLARHRDYTSHTLAQLAADVLGSTASVTCSNDGSGPIDISAPGVTKASALRLVAGSLGVAAEEVVAFGDMLNDVGMLRWAGHGVAMADAHPAALAAADEVTAGHDQDGVAVVLERWF